jgi:glycosyltransferase involved in cell wall biosynthesis
MRVLYFSHTPAMSGAEVAMLDLLRVLPDGIEPVVACPVGGPLGEALAGLGVRVLPVPEVRLSFRMRPLRTGRGLGDLLRSGLALARIAAEQRADLVHANSTRAGLVAALAVRFGAPPVVVHVHDCLPMSRAGRLTRRVVGGTARVVVVASRYSAASFLADGSCRASVQVVPYSVDCGRFRPDVLRRRQARARLGLPADASLVGHVAQLTPWKAQADGIGMLARLRQARPGARLLLVGSAQFATGFSRYDNRAYERHLRETVEQLELGDAVAFLGQRADLPELLRALDVLILPSWEEPFGIAVIEGMAMGLPVVATNTGGPSDVITHGVDGLLLPPARPDLWAVEIERLLAQPRLRAALGRRARRRALAFSSSRYRDGLLAAYAAALGERAAAA